MSQPVRIIISGVLGRMGQAVLRLSAMNPGIEVVGALEANEKLSDGTTEIACASIRVPIAVRLSDLKPQAGAVLIDFTTPAATREHVLEAQSLGTGMVIGTTGLSEEDHRAISEAAERIAVLVASNMSVGVNVLIGTVSRLAKALPDFDVEIVEMHHRHKKDAPSGTALSLAKAAAEARQLKLSDESRHGRHGMVGERTDTEIGIHAVRAGDIVGDHTVIFARDGERLELVHRAHSRDTFAAGALRAAEFVAQKPVGLYSMSDVLGL